MIENPYWLACMAIFFVAFLWVFTNGYKKRCEYLQNKKQKCGGL
jgi:hypothetical protein